MGNFESGAPSSCYSDDIDLPSPPRHTSADSEESSHEPRSKYKIFIPKHTLAQDNTFVTQLTQPPSSPSRIRGPRWKRPNPCDLLEPAEGNGIDNLASSNQSNAFNEDEADLREAIAASLESWEVENTTMDLPPSPRPAVVVSAPGSVPKRSMAVVQDMSSEFDDLPDDIFESSLSLSPHHEPTVAARHPREPTNARSTNPLPQRTNLRQTTLFGLMIRDQSQSGIERPSPPPRDQPPTHHVLHKEATETWVFPTNLGQVRDYQFNIAQKGLFHNLLVALPTGLGKTFIAATVMLNWFRWTRYAQMVFVAPTKPLVSQQLTACLKIAGIPRSQTTLLTGNVAPGLRTEEWQSKRVFFMTPQTLMNDLKTGIADPKRIVLLVVDEAHRATGGYAYVEVVKFLRRFNSSFRVLALTATPGSTVESVQSVIDGLEIARVEIRTEQSLDIRDYVHSRNIEVQTFKNSEDMMFCMDLLSKALQPSLDELRSLNAFWMKDPMSLTAYGLTKARQQWMTSEVGRNANFGMKGKVNSLINSLASLAHAVDLLKYHGIIPCYRHLMSFRSDTNDKKGGKTKRQIVECEHFKKLTNCIQHWVTNADFIGHPKLEYLKGIVLNHFMDSGEGRDLHAGRPVLDTRVMIFVHFRDSAEEVTKVLKRYEPMIRPHVFVGQSTAKGSEGMDQKTQLGIIQKFKEGTYNTIVATSIGEEGLDIGEVDLIVCYDSSSSPIRMLQRMGRTGRKRAGNIVLLLMQGKEEESYIKAKDNYEKMQQMIANGKHFTYHDGLSSRILPKDVKPVVDKRIVEIPEENSLPGLPEPKKNGRIPKRPPKKFHLPDNVETGFTTAAQLDSINGEQTGRKMNSKKQTPVRLKTPPPVEIPSIEEVLLTPDRISQLEIRYQNIGGTTPQFIRRPRSDAFPILQRVHRPIKLVDHGSMTHRMVKLLRAMIDVKTDCDVQYEKVLDSIMQSAEKRQARGISDAEDEPKKRITLTKEYIKITTTRGSIAEEKVPPHLWPHGSTKSDVPVLNESDSYDSGDFNNIPERKEATAESVPFYQSQTSVLNDDDLDMDIPELTTLLNDSKSKRKIERRKRLTIDDDDDEF